MRCKKHLSDRTSSIGVCSSCLNDRLLTLLHSQSQPDHLNQNPNPNPDPSPTHPPPSRFYTTPLLLPHKKQHQQHSHNNHHKFGLLSKLFRSRSTKPHPHVGPTTSTSTSSLSSYVSIANAKGMSPQADDNLPDCSPARTFIRPSPGRVRPSPSRSGLAFCLSPLVRPSPARHWSFPEPGEKTSSGGGGGGGGGASSSSSSKPHLSAAASFCANRSRKLADFGRFHRNR